MALFIHGRNHAQTYIYDQEHDKYVGQRRVPGGMKIIQFAGHKYRTEDPAELEVLRNVDDFKANVLQEVPEGGAAEKLMSAKGGAKVVCPICAFECRGKANFVSHFQKEHSGAKDEAVEKETAPKQQAKQGTMSVLDRRAE